MTAGVIAVIRFQSTLSMRRATYGVDNMRLLNERFQSTLSMRRATAFLSDDGRHRCISIHALHEESDHMWR